MAQNRVVVKLGRACQYENCLKPLNDKLHM